MILDWGRCRLPRRRRGNWSRSRFGLGRPNRENQPLPLHIERTANFSRHLDLLLRAAASDQSGIKAGNDFIEGQRNQNPIAICFSRENPRSGQAQFTKRDFHRATRQLGKDFFQRNRDRRISHFRIKHSWLKLQWKNLENALQRHFDALAMRTGRLRRGPRWRERPRHRGRSGAFVSFFGGRKFGGGRRRGLTRRFDQLPQKWF